MKVITKTVVKVRDSEVGSLDLGSRQAEVEEENILEEDFPSDNLLDQQDQEESKWLSIKSTISLT